MEIKIGKPLGEMTFQEVLIRERGLNTPICRLKVVLSMLEQINVYENRRTTATAARDAVETALPVLVGIRDELDEASMEEDDG